jgi:hypothetical protein
MTKAMPAISRVTRGRGSIDGAAVGDLVAAGLGVALDADGIANGVMAADGAAVDEAVQADAMSAMTASEARITDEAYAGGVCLVRILRVQTPKEIRRCELCHLEV